MNNSRRQFFKASAAMAAAASRVGSPSLSMTLAGLGALASQTSEAADLTAPYRAIVCLFMAGGNDSHNWVVPTDATGYAEYAAARPELAWPKAQLLPIASASQSAGRSFGLPLELQPLQSLYQAGRCAILANTGTLDRPLTKAEFLAGSGVPSRLFSHNDQQSMWQSMSPEGARSGWGGRMGDILMSANRYPVFTAVSAAGNAVLLTGSSVTQYQVGPQGPIAVDALQQGGAFGSTTAPAALRAILQSAGSNPFQSEYTRVMQRSVDTAATLQSALKGTAVAPPPSAPIALPAGGSLVLNDDPLAQQLRTVAQMIAAAPALGMKRQVFMVQMPGFDTHANQMLNQPLLMARVANSINWFFNALGGLGMQNNVTLFTASDFGRTLTSNGSGSDHGWGSHHFVVGGAVKGGAIYGRFPTVALGTNDEIGSGRLIPSTSVTEYAATLGRWLGLSSTEVGMVLPNLGNFTGAGPAFL